MATEIRVPTLGESISEATVGKWFKKAGEPVRADEPLVELETDKVTIEVPAPSAGTLGEITLVIAGAPARGNPVPIEEAVRQVQVQVESGQPRRDAIAAVAAESGVARRELYNAVVQRKSASERP